MFDWIAGPIARSGSAAEIPGFLQPSIDLETCTADLSSSPWVGPATLVALAAFLDGEVRRGIKAQFVRPVDDNLARYISRMGFPELLDQIGVPHGLPPVRSNSDLNGTSLVEVSKFSSESEVTELIELLTHRDLPDDLRDVMCEMLSEMGNNVPQHARVPHGFMAAQVVNGGSTLKLSVADAGVGILRTLQEKTSTDVGALRMALGGTSEFPDAGRGRGIPKMSSEIRLAGGEAQLLTGTAVVRITQQRDAYWSYRVGYPGTVFDASLPLDT